MSSSNVFPRKPVMKSSTTFAVLVLGPVLVLVAACNASDPCGAGLELDSYGCLPIPAAAAATATDAAAAATDGAAATDAGASEGDAAAATTSFGKTCTAMADCSGDAPICAAPQLPYCTQISCKTGEANAGACPSGWSCMSGPSGSACVKTS